MESETITKVTISVTCRFQKRYQGLSRNSGIPETANGSQLKLPAQVLGMIRIIRIVCGPGLKTRTNIQDSSVSMIRFLIIFIFPTDQNKCHFRQCLKCLFSVNISRSAAVELPVGIDSTGVICPALKGFLKRY